MQELASQAELSEKRRGAVRYPLLDFVRGTALLSMIAYHAVWDLVYLFGQNWAWYGGRGAYVWQQSICWCFILLSGFCAPMGRKSYRRGLLVLAASFLVSLVTILFMPEAAIRFGVLTLLGSCMLLSCLLRTMLEKIPPILGLLSCALLFFLLRNVPQGELGFEGLSLLSLPEGLYLNGLTAYLGFPPPAFSSADYFPLLPWMFLFFAGYYVNRVFEAHGLMRHLRGAPAPFLRLLGRHSLPIYLVHQPAIYALLSLWFMIF